MANLAATFSPELRRERLALLGALLAMAAASWVVLAWQSQTLDMGSMERVLTMDMGGWLFLGMWVLMMMAMMFPTAAPMILTFQQVSLTRQRQGRDFVPTWFFVAAYLLVWSLFGIAAFFVAAVLEEFAAHSAFLRNHGARLGGGVIMLAGLYQVSTLKRACLTTCRTPLAFIMTSWREGYGGALLMGLSHGTYCLGCCWLLFVLLFPLGIMSVAAMGAVTVLIFAEKSLPHGRKITIVTGAVLLIFGLAVVIHPDALPYMIGQGSGAMDAAQMESTGDYGIMQHSME